MLMSRGFRAAKSRGFTRIVAFSRELNEVVFDDHLNNACFIQLVK